MTNESSRKTDTLIIGFGLTTIPLIRELERTGSDYTVISSGPNIWEQLEAAGRLDFDLVSSYMSSVYSFELARTKNTESRFPTAREFHEFIKRYKADHRQKVVEDWVTEVENREAGSVVHTRSGAIYEANNIVIGTAFRRKIHHSILNYDFEHARGRTVVITTMGDSANMFVSKLLGGDNRIILVSNGFFCLDKLINHHGVAFALDDVEMHNVGNISGYLYKMVLPQGQIMASSNPRTSKPFLGSNLYMRYPFAIRDLDLTPALNMGRGSPFNPNLPNGLRITKYWPIDTYKESFEDTLEESIRSGYLLNDIAYLIDRKIVELWPRQEVFIDRENRVLRWRDQVVQFDDIIESDQEAPNLPPITIERPGQPSCRYEYYYRDCFMGLMPRDLPNTYFIGYARAMTGGVNNVSEMQCIFTHKMITDAAFRKEITRNLDERIAAYNGTQYPSKVRSGADNLVFYGQYNEIVARLMGIESKFSQCRSLEDVGIHFFFPNTIGKYRQRGPYAVEGMEEVIRSIHRSHRGFSISSTQVLNFVLMLVTAIVAIVQMFRADWIPLSITVLLLLVAFFGPALPLINTNSNRINHITNPLMVLGLGATLWLGHPLVPLASLGLGFVVVYICRKLAISRVWFNDLQFKSRPEFDQFYARYIETFRKVHHPSADDD
ncbi:hypothetical protein [Paraliomyxa miuraensis]|uniref:hypothetical protein n=1 Tax=Paraliomyxa miuraensis TaxID=376150 RepID=UPI002255F86B|nr:hypothetical protein [Paraliomyxa miuraensis]MCX4244107.1 hypothetical protein [Paraliomyxa miuraensis]